MKNVTLGMMIALSTTAGIASADVVTQSNGNASYTWLMGSLWSDGLAPHAGAEYTTTMTLRTNNTTGAAVTAFDYKLTVLTGGVLSIKGTASTVELHMNGGSINNGYTNRSTPVSLAGTVYIESPTAIKADNGTTSMIISATLIGDKALTINTAGVGPSLTLSGNGEEFSGDWNINANAKVIAGGTSSLGSGNISVASGATLDLDYDLNSAAALTLAGALVLDRALTFGQVTIGGVSLDSGTYSYAELNSLFDANIADGGSGSITVAAVPEAATGSILALCAMGLLLAPKSRKGVLR